MPWVVNECGRRGATGAEPCVLIFRVTWCSGVRNSLTVASHSGAHVFADPPARGLKAALAVRDVERMEADFDHAERAQDHRRVDMAHMGDPERLPCELADPDAQHDAAFVRAIAVQRERIIA